MIRDIKKQQNYSILAEIYDEVMEDVNYETWTDYIDEIILTHNPKSEHVLELACGTGTMALSLEELDCYSITATDGSPHMIRKAREKADRIGSDVQFLAMDFLNLQLDQTFDVVYMVFDSINYLHTREEIFQLFEQVRSVLNPDGIFIFDFTTPRNSRTAIRFLDNEYKTIGETYTYRRNSLYDPDEQVHINRFFIEKKNHPQNDNTETYQEEHTQKIYTYREMKSIIKQTKFSILDAYDGFELKPAHDRSLRITMVLQ